MQKSKTALYRHYDENRNLLYVGISLSAVARLEQHKRCAKWSGEISTVEAEYFEGRRQAEIAEQRAIMDESPQLSWSPGKFALEIGSEK